MSLLFQVKQINNLGYSEKEVCFRFDFLIEIGLLIGIGLEFAGILIVCIGVFLDVKEKGTPCKFLFCTCYNAKSYKVLLSFVCVINCCDVLVCLYVSIDGYDHQIKLDHSHPTIDHPHR